MKNFDIDFILTFDEKPQQMLNSRVSSETLETESGLTEHVLSFLNEDEKQELKKVSCCIFAEANQLPKWFLECNGKLWFNQ